MPTTYAEFGPNTEATEVAKAFKDRVRGKTVLVTGGSIKGIGYATAYAMASQAPAHLILAGRTPAKLTECIDALKAAFPAVDVRPLPIDLSSQASVRKAAADVLGWADIPTIDYVFNTAGVMGLPQRTLSVDGIEMQMATNHIGHWLLSCLLMPKLIAAARGQPKGSVRIVNVSAGSAYIGAMRWSDMNFDVVNKHLPAAEQPNYAFMTRWGYTGLADVAYAGIDGYNRSKVANVLAAIGTTHALYATHGILSVAVHPGVILTELGRAFEPVVRESVNAMVADGTVTYKTLGAGASTSLVAALDDKVTVEARGGPRNRENYGAFMVDCQVSDGATDLATSSAEAARLWALSEDLVKEKFSW
ncbi:uncharacterized protein SPSK_09496 [Sporothrix schenckii 1099-18]|uniref:Ketoreductase domain-containing protein n=2 Tax=Sporothrix schenckii TaxID=29908 RepID=U7Q7R5_SPOS1|nr:uncharacterized protein SPSK_09496 [Sporothrix schenckii 1099-18]ERT03257.1 hypothetical protein HMPREF1624_01563 [Sporothrix schenckii ATCC 58251]KJR84314.1 hypothetical protein SPSK_09496 [Sporothrix schenckii 1099-18]